MPSKPAQAFDGPRAYLPIGGWEVLEVAGRDAGGFLQRQTMNDVNALAAPTTCQWNGLLSAKGRVLALFVLVRTGAETFWMLAPDCRAGELEALLRPYVLRSKLSLQMREDLAADGTWIAQDSTGWLAMSCVHEPESGLQLSLPAVQGSRLLRVGIRDPGSPADDDATARWRLDDLRCGLPRLSAAQTDAWTPQMLALERLGAFSLKKGCYPGQEIVARTHYLGRSKRRLQRFDTEQPVAEGSVLRDGSGNEIGVSICNASWRNHHTVLVVGPMQRMMHGDLHADAPTLQAVEFAGEAPPPAQ